MDSVASSTPKKMENTERVLSIWDWIKFIFSTIAMLLLVWFIYVCFRYVGDMLYNRYGDGIYYWYNEHFNDDR